MHVEVAGGGFSGLTAALAFAQAGCSVRLHERAASVRSFGSGIFIWENGLQVLERLGVTDAVEGAHRAVVRETRDKHDRLMNTIHWDEGWNRRTYVVVRGRALEALTRAATRAGVEIVLNSEVTAATADGTISLANGSQCRADLVVLADGANSRSVESLGIIKHNRFLADGAVRVLLPRTEAERLAKGGDHFIEWWSGSRRLLYCPCGENELYVALFSLDRDTGAHSLPLNKDVWLRSLPHLEPLLQRIAEAGGRWDRFQVTRLKQWSAGRGAILGDAAHSMAPNLGQGACLAMVNAFKLAGKTGGAGRLDEALRDWERVQRPITDQTQRISTFYGKMAEWPEFARNTVLWMAGKSRWLMNQRLKAANHPL